MANYIFVDNSNVWIEGQYVSAVKRKLARDINDAHNREIADHQWRMDFGRLFDLAGGYDKAKVGRAVLFGSKPPATDSLWNAAQRSGFEVIALDRVRGKEKKVDTGVTTEMIATVNDFRLDPTKDGFTLVSGDRDFVPPVDKLRAWGYRVSVVFWDHAAAELKTSASEFRSLNRDLDRLQQR